MLPSVPYSFNTESIIFHFCFRAEHLFDQPQSSFNMVCHFGYYIRTPPVGQPTERYELIGYVGSSD